jgi:flagellar protein FliT
MSRIARQQGQELSTMNSVVLNYYEAIEQASQEMLDAARRGDWDHVVKLESACALLIAQLKRNAGERPLASEEARLKSKIMQRILVNDAEIRQLAEPWLEDLDNVLAGRPKTVH